MNLISNDIIMLLTINKQEQQRFQYKRCMMKFDKFRIGQVFETRSLKLTKEDIMRFAEKFDPLYMHLDEKKATQGRFNGIIASGIHTIGISYKLWIEQGIFGDDVIAGIGMNISKTSVS